MFIINFMPSHYLTKQIKRTLICLLLICSYALSTNVSATSILLLGDSLSASKGMSQKDGWVSLLNTKFQQQKSSLNIINASISGETTGGGLARVDDILTQNKIDILLIELGGNDGLRGFPPTLIKNNLLQITQKAQSKNINVLIMDIRIPPNYGKRYNKLFSQVFKQTAQETNSTLLPFFINDIAIKPELMQQDGIHPNKQAQPMIAALMYKELTKRLEKEK